MYALLDTITVSDNDIKIAVAIITGLVGLLVALFSAILAQKNNKDLELLRFKLSGVADEEKARRDYQYEARKRLYEQIEPLLFQLVEHGENALARVYSLARTAKLGNLEPRTGWVSNADSYYMTSTIYKFLAPLVVVRLIQNQLTLVDLTVDPVVHKQYLLAKMLLWSFTEDFELAQITNPPLPYDPNRADWATKRKQDPAQYWRQGISTGRLDNLLAALTTTGSNGNPRCMSYGEFQNLFRDRHTSADDTFDTIADIFQDFHPKTRPILWRILVAQAYIYRNLIDISDAKTSPATDTGDVLTPSHNEIARLDRKRFDWRQTPDEASDTEVLKEPFEAAQLYLERRLKGEW